ncbi:MAG: hypothetical protein KAV87_01665 [Desulfobacteraceae bacterium]|nr:hypothetical protein [Desulfobacteraceae bacterium]
MDITWGDSHPSLFKALLITHINTIIESSFIQTSHSIIGKYKYIIKAHGMIMNEFKRFWSKIQENGLSHYLIRPRYIVSYGQYILHTLREQWPKNLFLYIYFSDEIGTTDK